MKFPMRLDILKGFDKGIIMDQFANHFILIQIYSPREWDANQFRLVYVREPR